MKKVEIIEVVVEEFRPYIDAMVECSGGVKMALITKIKHDRSQEDITAITFEKDDIPRHIVASITAAIVSEWEDTYDLPLGYKVHVKSRDGNCIVLFIDAERW